MNSNHKFRVTEEIYATQRDRFLNLIIDWVCKIILGLVVGLLLGLIAILTDNYSIVEWLDESNRLIDILFEIGLILIYYNLFEITTGRSIGKYFTKTIVVLEDGSKPPMEKILLRTFSRLIPFEAFSFLDPKPRGMHDRYSDTYVVKVALLNEKMNAIDSIDEIGKEV